MIVQPLTVDENVLIIYQVQVVLLPFYCQLTSCQFKELKLIELKIMGLSQRRNTSNSWLTLAMSLKLFYMVQQSQQQCVVRWQINRYFWFWLMMVFKLKLKYHFIYDYVLPYYRPDIGTYHQQLCTKSTDILSTVGDIQTQQ